MILINNRCKGVRVEGKGECYARWVYEKPIKIRRKSTMKKNQKKITQMFGCVKIICNFAAEKGSKCCLIYISKGPDKLNVKGFFIASRQKSVL